ncbi:MAG: LysR family transcriptional regulator [Burkholderiales bacterium]|nr:LysR family transcriptional regulator [Burkholderiales bacterium]
MDSATLDLNLLRVLDALIETRKVTAAAQALDLSQPAVSFALAKLRRSFGDPLFVRTAGGMQPTPLAAGMAGAVREALELVRTRLMQQAAFDAATSGRTFTLSLSDAGEMVFLPRLLAALRERAPGINLVSTQVPAEELQRAMEAGRIDLAAGYFPDLRGDAFYQQRLFDQPYVCLMRAGRALPGGRLTRREFLAAQHAVVLPQGRSQEIFERALAERSLTRRVVLAIPHFMSVPFVIMDSDLIATVPLSVAQAFCAAFPLKYCPLPIRLESVVLKQFWHVRFHRDPAGAWLRGLMRELFAGPGSRAP